MIPRLETGRVVWAEIADPNGISVLAHHRYLPVMPVRLVLAEKVIRAFLEVAPREQAVEEEQDEGAARGYHEAERADRAHAQAVPEEHERAAADHAAGDADQQRRQGAA